MKKSPKVKVEVSKEDQLKRNSRLLIIYTLLGGISSFFFYFMLARVLSVEDYSLFYAFIAITYFFMIPQETVKMVTAKYTTKFLCQNKSGKIRTLYLDSNKFIFKYSIIGFVLFLLLYPLVGELLHATFTEYLLFSFCILVIFLVPVSWGVLQGMNRFNRLGILSFLYHFFLLIVAGIFVLFGLGLNGSLVSIAISDLLCLLVGLLMISPLLKVRKEKFNEKGIFRYSVAVFAILGLLIIMNTIDVFIARYFFSRMDSGLYSGISTISKTIFFVAIAVARVMFPKVAEIDELGKGDDKTESKSLLKTSLLINGTMFLVLVLAAILFPSLIVEIVLGTKYLEIAPLIKYSIISIAFLSFSTIVAFYNLSLNWNKKITARIIAAFVFLEVVLTITFHSSLKEFVLMTLIANVWLFLVLLSTIKTYPKPAINKQKGTFKSKK